MMNPIVLYRSHYGFTKQYAQWISEALACPFMDVKDFPLKQLTGHDPVIFGGGLYASSVAGGKWLLQNEKALQEKHLIVFTVGVSPTDDSSCFQSMMQEAFPSELRERICFFHLRGGMDYAKLSPVHRIMMAGLATVLRRKEQPTESEQMILDSYGKSFDFSNKASIEPLISYVSKLT